jgi:molecular chaperone HscB
MNCKRIFFSRNIFSKNANLVNFSQKYNYNCWSCNRLLTNEERREFFCPCDKKKILPVNISINYFDMFKLNKYYDVDIGLLTKNFRQLMRKLHPDIYTQSADVFF